MRILFDQGTPAPLRRRIVGHDVFTANEMGWSELRNGDLLRAAEQQFDLLITTDHNLRHEQNLRARRLANLVLMTTAWPTIERDVSVVLAAIGEMKPAEYRELGFAA